MLALLAAILTGCGKFETENTTSRQTFTATIGDVTRTVLNGGKVFWEEGDEIFINGISFLATPDPSDPTKATFTKTNISDPNAKTDENGVYVATFGCSMDSRTGVGVIPETVEYSASGSIQAPMIAKSRTSELSFKNICSVIEVTLKGTETIGRIEFNANGKALSGEFTIPDGQSAVMSKTTGDAVLDMGAGVKLDSKGKVFRIAVPAGSYSGFNIKVTDISNRAWKKTAGKTVNTAANTIYRLSFTPSFPSVVDGALTGVYTIDANGTKVNFASGNLYYYAGKWSFAQTQTETPGARWSDKRPVTHFYWTDIPSVAVQEDYDIDHDDTGSEVFFTNKSDFSVYGNSGWRALTTAEWDYLLNGRKFTQNGKTYTGEHYSYLRVILNVGGVYGLLLFPDGFKGQEDVMLGKYIPEGCAFLPGAGFRLYGNAVAENLSGAYWTPDADAVVGQALTFGAAGVTTGVKTNKYNGLSLRLAVPVK